MNEIISKQMRLFEPAKLGKLSVQNRIVMAAMGLGDLVDADGTLSQKGIDYYVARAKGGTGLIITSGARPTRQTERHIRRLRVETRTDIAWLKRLADAVHYHGARVALQMSAGAGRVGRPDYSGQNDLVAPSALRSFWDAKLITRELTIPEIEHLVAAFGFAAEITASAGVDAIELHGHEGYLFDQFMTGLWNRRADRYGGDLDGRLRFCLEIIKALKRGAGADFPIIYRFGLTHYLDGGRQVSEGLEIARKLESAGVDALDIDAGCYETWYWPHPPTTQPPGCMVDLAEMVKKALNIPVMAAGKLGDPGLAESVLEEGKADFIVLGRPLLADPEWPTKVKEGRLQEIRPCLGDHECLRRVREGKYLSCAVNPVTGRERELSLRPLTRQKRVLVIGGGPAGMEAATTAARRGHKVTLLEKSSSLGGNLIPASIPSFKQDYRRFMDYLCSQVKLAGITVRLDAEATAEVIAEICPDSVIVATGGSLLTPDIPGVNDEKVISAVDLLVGNKEAGEPVVVLGGGLIGCETALYLAQKGKNVTILEATGNVATDMFAANRMHLLRLLAEAQVTILTNTAALEITEDGVLTGNKDGQRELRAGTVVLATGLKPNNNLGQTVMSTLPQIELYTVGDCVEPHNVASAIWEGFEAGRRV